MREPGIDRVVFGAAALGMAYGLPRPGADSAVEPGEDAAGALVELALALGIRTFDTAPAYGASEARLGRALRGRGAVWTKVASGDPSASLDLSLIALDRPQVDLLQWHNWSPAFGHNEEWRRAWLALRGDPRVRRLGATTYGRADAVAAARSGFFDVVQVEFNLLNQGVVAALAADAACHDVEVAVRSIYLQGALTDEGRALPELPQLVHGVAAARSRAGHGGMTKLALLAALTNERIDRAIIGFDQRDQLDVVRATIADPLPAAFVLGSRELDLGATSATDPRSWPRRVRTPDDGVPPESDVAPISAECARPRGPRE